MGNAIKFTESGEVVLRVEQEAGNNGTVLLQFAISDTGIGIPEEKIARIFESFAQVDASTTRQYGGSGLGLTIARYLVELMGGRIWVESKLGAGSTFYFTAHFRIGRELASQPDLQPLGLKGLRTLVVDDNSTNRLILTETLAAWGALLTTAENGAQALTELVRASQAGEPYGLVLLDCRMPGMDGFHLAEHIQNHSSLAAMTILMLTSEDRAAICPMPQAWCRRLLSQTNPALQLSKAIQSALSKTQVGVETQTIQENSYRAAHQLSFRLLLADDSEAMSFLIQSYLRDTGCSIDVAGNGEIAVERFRSGHYDLVLMDLQMPVMDGHIATQRIREWEREHRAKPVPIIALSAYALQTEIDKSRDAGFTAYLTKPIRRQNLLDAIERYSASTDARLDWVKPSERIRLVSMSAYAR